MTSSTRNEQPVTRAGAPLAQHVLTATTNRRVFPKAKSRRKRVPPAWAAPSATIESCSALLKAVTVMPALASGWPLRNRRTDVWLPE